ncbi:MAG: hypothetical protein CMQ43_11230 [Gammaproteobacteria bacterium]|nr:hypothetical protein [Gammaproteobacteria bacterium]MBK81467.1 hypothetical protein [Gammaproteobacteria bacterium]|tara:strand:- start:131 stop:823 length:693 start_codon:yes stop_codon:yes gene_type:complete
MRRAALWIAAAMLLGLAGAAAAHTIAGDDATFVRGIAGPAVGPFVYLGAKHMVTGYDHLLFLVGVVFFLQRLRDVVLYVSLFTLGHSLTLIGGVLGGLAVDAHLIDAVIGLSVVYKAFENLGGFREVLGIEPDTRVAVVVFGLFHGLGLATRLQDMTLSADGLVTNLLSFNLGVELGQVLALLFVVALLLRWRASAAFTRQAFAANTVLMCAGFVLTGHQLTGFALGGAP